MLNVSVAKVSAIPQRYAPMADIQGKNSSSTVRIGAIKAPGRIVMKEQYRSLKLSIFIHKAAQLGFLAPLAFLAPLLIMMCAMLSCDQAELASSPSDATALTSQQMQLLPASSLEANLLQATATFAAMKTGSDQSEIAASLADRVIKVGMIVNGALNTSSLYGAQLAMFEINQAGGVLGIPVELLTNGGLTQPVVSDDVYGPRIGGEGRDGDVYGPPTPGEPGEIMGGIMGFPIALVVRDNKDDPDLSAKLAAELITQENVVAIIGPDFSRHALRVAPVAQSYGVPMVATTATNPEVTAAGDFVFMAAFDDTFQARVIASFARGSLKAKTAALLTQAGDPSSEGLSTFFAESFTALGGTIVAMEVYSRGDTDFTPQLTAIAAQAPGVVFIPGFVPEVPLAIKQARSIPQKNATGIAATFLGGDGWEDPRLVPLAGAAIEGSYFTTFFSPGTPEDVALNVSEIYESVSGMTPGAYPAMDYDVVKLIAEAMLAQSFVGAYESMFGMIPDGYAAMGYDALRLVATAIRRAGCVDKEAIRDQLAATRTYRGATYIHSYDENRHPIKSAVIMQIKNGRIQFHKQVEP
jgi:branched-chain amino acid transport system substrate-binding protein